MKDTEFHTLADRALGDIADRLEGADEKGLLDLEHQQGVITVATEGGKQFIVSKHAPTRQLWLSSPVSGGLHFSFDAAAQDWQLPDKRNLLTLLLEELAQIVGAAL